MKINLPVKRLSVEKRTTIAFMDEDKDKYADQKNGATNTNDLTAETSKVPKKPQPPTLIVTPETDSQASDHNAEIEPPFNKLGVCASLLLVILYLPLVYTYFLYEIIKTKWKNFQKFNSTSDMQIHGIAAGAATFILVWLFVMTTLVPKFGRRPFTVFVFPAMYFSIMIMAFFQFNPYSNYIFFLEKNRPILTFWAVLFSSAICLFSWAIFSKQFHYKWIPVLLSVSFQYILIDEVQLLVKKMKISYPVLIIWLIAQGAWTLYQTIDLEFICTRRRKLYKENDWFLVMVHLQTDIFWRFWIDLHQELRKRFMKESEAGVVETY